MLTIQKNKRPESLKLATVTGFATGVIDASIREFLDEFYVEKDASKKEKMLADEPPLVDDAKANAYFAAIAEHLSFKNNLRVPAWCQNDNRFLKRPYFPGTLESFKAILLVESPVAFRRKLIFVGMDPLYRPRRDAVGIG